MTRRVARACLLVVLAIGACAMVVFFNDPNPQVAIAAFVAWACFLVAIYKVR